MIRIGSTADQHYIEIIYRGDSWELQEYTPADTSSRLYNGKNSHRCKKRWYGKLGLAMAKSLDLMLAWDCGNEDSADLELAARLIRKYTGMIIETCGDK